MKIVAISGSPRDKYTNYMLRTVLEAAGEEHELIILKQLNIRACFDCGKCHEKPFSCSSDDDMTAVKAQLTEADAIVLGSPTYFNNVSGVMKDFIDRSLPFYFSRQLEGKPVALVVVGSEPESEKESILSNLQALREFSELLGMTVVGSVYATNSNPTLKESELIALGKKLMDAVK